MVFTDRRDAGRFLARRLAGYAGRSDVLVLGLPRGGVPVAFEVARRLGAPLDVFIVRKLGVPGAEELAMGAIASGGVLVLNEDVIRRFGLSSRVVAEVVRREHEELVRREERFRPGHPAVDVRGRVVILVDDGLATGASARAAVRALRRAEPAQLILAAPVAARQTCATLSGEVDEVVCATTPEPFLGVGVWYENFDQTTDEEVAALLSATAPVREAAPATF